MRKDEIKRQIFHAGLGLFTVVLIYLGIAEGIGSSPPLDRLAFLPVLTRPFLITLIVCSILIVLASIRPGPGLEWLLENFERPDDRRRFPGKGVFFSLLAVVVLSLFFESPVVGASLLIISVGDSTSHVIGKKFGRINHPLSKTKKIEGNIAGAILAGIGSSIFVNPIIAFIAAFTAMFVEGIDFDGLADEIFEDNFVVTIVAGLVIVLLNGLI